MKCPSPHKRFRDFVVQPRLPAERHCPEETRVFVGGNAALQGSHPPRVEFSINLVLVPAANGTDQFPIIRILGAKHKIDSLPFKIPFEIEKPRCDWSLRRRERSGDFDTRARNEFVCDEARSRYS